MVVHINSEQHRLEYNTGSDGTWSSTNNEARTWSVLVRDQMIPVEVCWSELGDMPIRLGL